MRNRRIAALIGALFVVLLVGACASIGLGKQGNPFNYDNAAKLKKGMSMEQVTTLLEGEPRATGRQMNTGYTHWHFEFVKSGGVGAGIPILGASASKGQGYVCDVKVVDFNYHTNQIGSEGVSF